MGSIASVFRLLILWILWMCYSSYCLQYVQDCNVPRYTCATCKCDLSADLVIFYCSNAVSLSWATLLSLTVSSHSTTSSALFFSPKYHSAHPEKYLFSLSKKMFSGSNYPKKTFYLILKTEALLGSSFIRLPRRLHTLLKYSVSYCLLSSYMYPVLPQLACAHVRLTVVGSSDQLVVSKCGSQ